MLDDYKHAREAVFEDAFKREFGRIEDYRFKGFNHALGCEVQSKEHYKRLLKERGLMPSDAAEQIAEEARSIGFKRKDLPLSEEATAIIRHLRSLKKNKDGTIPMGGRLIEAMVKIRAIGNGSTYEPAGALSGGFC